MSNPRVYTNERDKSQSQIVVPKISSNDCPVPELTCEHEWDFRKYQFDL